MKNDSQKQIELMRKQLEGRVSAEKEANIKQAVKIIFDDYGKALIKLGRE